MVWLSFEVVAAMDEEVKRILEDAGKGWSVNREDLWVEALAKCR